MCRKNVCAHVHAGRRGDVHGESMRSETVWEAVRSSNGAVAAAVTVGVDSYGGVLDIAAEYGSAFVMKHVRCTLVLGDLRERYRAVESLPLA